MFSATATALPASQFVVISGGGQSVKYGELVGGLYGVAQILQTAGLAHTPASVSGFITGMYVVLTPLLAAPLLVQDATGRVVGSSRFGNAVPAGTVTFTSLDPTAVAVNGLGTVTALKLSVSVGVIASAGGKADTTTVSVVAPGGGGGARGRLRAGDDRRPRRHRDRRPVRARGDQRRVGADITHRQAEIVGDEIGEAQRHSDGGAEQHLARAGEAERRDGCQQRHQQRR